MSLRGSFSASAFAVSFPVALVSAFAPEIALASVSLVPGLAPAALPGTSVASEPDLAGVVVVDRLLPFRIESASGALLFQGHLQDRVVRSSATGALHFYYRIRDTVPGLNGIVRSLVVRPYPVGVSASTLVDWRADGLGTTAPQFARRSAGSGEMIAFDFDPVGDVLVGGRESRFAFVKTRNTRFAPVGKALVRLVSGESADLVVYVPVP